MDRQRLLLPDLSRSWLGVQVGAPECVVGLHSGVQIRAITQRVERCRVEEGSLSGKAIHAEEARPAGCKVRITSANFWIPGSIFSTEIDE